MLWGLFPHTFILIAAIFGKIKSIIKTKVFVVKLKDNYSKFLMLNFIAVAVILLFFSASGTKLVTYILPVYPFIAVFLGAIWIRYADVGETYIDKLLFVMNFIFVISVVMLCFSKYAIPEVLYDSFFKIQIISIIILVAFVIINITALLNRKRLEVFISLAVFISFLSGFLTPYIYKFDYAFGQNDLMYFARLAKEKGYTISTYKTGKKYSLLYYSDLLCVEFQMQDDELWLKHELEKNNNLLIVRNKDINNLPVKVEFSGMKYSLVGKL